jgi:voltage-gated potassium channel
VPHTVPVSLLSTAVPEPRVDAWQRSTEVFMAVLAILFLAIYATEVLASGLSGGWRVALRVADLTIWSIFIAEFAIRLSLAHRRGRYALRHVPDIAMLALPFLRALRVLRLVPLLRALNRWVADSLRGKLVVYGTTTAALLVFTGALAVLDAERGAPGANINTFGVALWWSCVTICTVGYGDYVPVTTEGKFIAVGMMVSGLMLVGAITASFATWLFDQLRVEEEEDQAETQADIAAVHSQVGRLTEEIAALKKLLVERPHGDERPASASS